jgi:hypothetical protein
MAMPMDSETVGVGEPRTREAAWTLENSDMYAVLYRTLWQYDG